MIKLKDILNESSGNYKDGRNLRGSQWLFDFIKYEEAGKAILSHGLKKGFGGLNSRRQKESEHFLKNL